MATSKKATPFSRLRSIRSRKNGSPNGLRTSTTRVGGVTAATTTTTNVSTSVIATTGASAKPVNAAQKPIKSSFASTRPAFGLLRKRGPYPPYFTVDDLAAFRRRRLPHHKHLVDTLRPLSGRLGDATEYRDKFRRSFAVVSADDSIMNWKKKKMKLLNCAKRDDHDEHDDGDDDDDDADAAAAATATATGEHYKAEYAAQFVPHPDARRTCPVRPVDHFDECDELRTAPFARASETAASYRTFEGAAHAPLLRQSTHLQVEGDFDGVSVARQSYAGHADAGRSTLARRPTNLRLEGDMRLATEHGSTYVEFAEMPPRARLQRRHTTLELAHASAGHCRSLSSEYRRAFRPPPEPRERATLARSMENLLRDDDDDDVGADFESEYARNYVDFGVTQPPIRFRERRRSLVEAPRTQRHRHQRQRCQVKEALNEGHARPSYSPEYKDSFVRFAAHRPTIKRPHTNLVPASGIGETESELKSKLKEFPAQPKTASARPSTNLRPHGGIEVCPDYGAASCAGALRTVGRQQQQQQQLQQSGHEKPPFSDVRDLADERFQKNVNFTDETTSGSLECMFRKGKRLPVTKKTNETTKLQESKRPAFRLEVTNPDQVQKPYEKIEREGAPFVVIDENNNTNQWIKNKQNKKQWTPSWMKV